jgi:protein-tyrosine phosphatase
LIDIHHHCLPGVDDGPRTLDEAIELCAMAADEGIETIVATPHVLRGRWRSRNRTQIENAVAELRERTHDTPKLLAGSEYYFAHDIADILHTEAVLPLAGSRYVLVEFASHAVPPMVEQPLHRAMLDGWIPIIAHPERNQVFQAKPELLRSLIRLGAKTQVTAGSLTGLFGVEAQESATSWLRSGMVHFIATDAHNTARRPPRFRNARARVAEIAGEAVAQALFVDNPRAVIEKRGLPYEPDLPEERPESAGLMSRVRRLIRR